MRTDDESLYLSRRVKLTAVHFLFVLPVWLNISPDETTWTPFVWETMDRNNTQSLLGARTWIQTTILLSTPPLHSSLFPSTKEYRQGPAKTRMDSKDLSSRSYQRLSFVSGLFLTPETFLQKRQPPIPPRRDEKVFSVSQRPENTKPWEKMFLESTSFLFQKLLTNIYLFPSENTLCTFLRL